MTKDELYSKMAAMLPVENTDCKPFRNLIKQNHEYCNKSADNNIFYNFLIQLHNSHLPISKILEDQMIPSDSEYLLKYQHRLELQGKYNLIFSEDFHA